MPTSILGLGNVLMSDDGFGPAVVRAFDERYIVGSDVSVVDLGTPGLDLSPWLADAERVILVDTVKSRMPPGTLQLYEKDELLRHVPFARVGPHEPGVKETLLALDFAGRAPRDALLIGVVAERTEMGLDLSPSVVRAVPAALIAIVAALDRFGVHVEPRLRPVECKPWWAGSTRLTAC